MFDFGLSYTHLFVLGLIAFIAIGREDMPIVLRKVGQFMNKMRSLAREFQGHVDVAMKDAGVADLKNELQGLKGAVNSTMAETNTALSLPSLQATPNSSSGALSNGFAKFFGEAVQGGETLVAGKPVKSETAQGL